MSPLSRSVLILNGHYEPLTVCHAKRALVLVFLGRAEMIEASGLVVRSSVAAFPVPSVIRVLRAIRPHGRAVALTKKNVLKRDGHRCQYCASAHGKMTTDHVVPRSAGGADSWANLVCACAGCNRRKGNRTPQQAGMQLLRQPSAPRGVGAVILLGALPDPRWRIFLGPRHVSLLDDRLAAGMA
ncbi:MAG: HNH endonuclease [Gemmatimonadetes bacterium]|nr:HNH endonuclease [Gemmatimonadota bacterium]